MAKSLNKAQINHLRPAVGVAKRRLLEARSVVPEQMNRRPPLKWDEHKIKRPALERAAPRIHLVPPASTGLRTFYEADMGVARIIKRLIFL